MAVRRPDRHPRGHPPNCPWVRPAGTSRVL